MYREFTIIFSHNPPSKYTPARPSARRATITNPRKFKIMVSIIVQFPQIVIENKVIEVTEAQAENLLEHSSDDERAKFVWSKLTDQEQNWTFGEQMLEGAFECGYAKIKRI